MSDIGGPRPLGKQDDQSLTAQQRYEELKIDREPFLMRARRFSLLTLPYLFRFVGANDTSETPAAWQSLGARCVKSLSSKLTLTIFPPGISPIRLDPSKQVLAELSQLGQDERKRGDLKIQIGKGLREAEKEFTNGITEDLDSSVFAKGSMYEIVGGTHGYQMYTDGTWRGIPLDNFVTVRDGQGNLLEFVIEDDLVWLTLPKAARDFLDTKRPQTRGDDGTMRYASKIKLYTHGRLNEDGKYEVYQESCGFRIPNSHWTWQRDYLPFLFVPFNLLPREHYGRSYVEEYEADLQALDGGEEIIQEGTHAAALLIRFVKPGGVTSKDALAKARNGAVLTGDESDIYTMETNKNADFEALQEQNSKKEQRLGEAFLLNVSPRDAERVTAEEIRWIAQAAQEQLGSLYLEMVGTKQKPYARLKMAALMRSKRMTPLPPKQVQVIIATGAAALTRNAQIQILDDLTMPANPIMQQAAGTVIDAVTFYQQRAVALGADQDGLVKTHEMIEEEQQQQLQQQQMLAATPNMVKGGADIVGKGIDHGAALAQNAQAAALANQQQGQQGASAQ